MSRESWVVTLRWPPRAFGWTIPNQQVTTPGWPRWRFWRPWWPWGWPWGWPWWLWPSGSRGYTGGQLFWWCHQWPRIAICYVHAKKSPICFLVSDGGEMSLEQAGKDDDWRGSAGQLGWKSSKLSGLHVSMSFIAPCKIFYHEFYPKKYKENHTFVPRIQQKCLKQKPCRSRQRWRPPRLWWPAELRWQGRSRWRSRWRSGSTGWMEDLSTQV